MTIDFCLLQKENACLLDNLAPDVFDKPINPAQLSAFLDDPRHVLCVAIDQDTVIGMASAVECFHPDKDPQLFINEVGVGSSYRNRGIGRKLLRALMDEAAARGCVSAWLVSDARNESAHACFESVPRGEPPQTLLLYEWKPTKY